MAWVRGVLPLLSRPLVMAWLLTFCGVFLELPISQLLYAPGSPPASVAIEDNLATTTSASAWRRRSVRWPSRSPSWPGARRLPAARAGWLATDRRRASVAEPIAIDVADKVYPGGTGALKSTSRSTSSPGRSSCCSGRPARARRRCCAAWPGSSGSQRPRSRSASASSPTARTHVPPERRDLSMVFQDYALWPHLIALDNVAFALRRRGLSRAAVPGAGRRRCSTASASPRSPSGTPTSCPAASSSGSRSPGRWSRDTGLILCDEPLSNLDADLRERMRVEISALVREAGRDDRLHHPRPGRGIRARRPGRRARSTGGWCRSARRRTIYTTRRPRSWRGSPGWPASCRCA